MPCIDASIPGVIYVPSGATWDDLVLPAQCIQKLHEYVLWVTHRGKMDLEWRGSVAEGPIALISGPSGTGKTFAAKVVANTLDLPLIRVDLGQLISKYIGETEKNLDALFGAVTNEPMLLLFDEADSLFAQRTEVKDAYDRFENLEVPFLLSKLERHQGPSILTSNLRHGFDPAFVRRFQMVIDFPFPDEGARSKLWRRVVRFVMQLYMRPISPQANLRQLL
jgi:SpoVK/Ycf46/Vps4 family AAA+-type ATPase